MAVSVRSAPRCALPGTIGGAAVAPVLYGFAGDASGPTRAIFTVAMVCLLTLPLAWALRPSLRRRP